MIRADFRSIIPLAAIAVFLAEYLLDKTEPRYESPWWWLSMIVLLAAILGSQLLRTRALRDEPTPDERRSKGLVRGSRDVRDVPYRQGGSRTEPDE